MSLPTTKPVMGSVAGDNHLRPSLRGTIRKSALLNVAVVLTSLPVLVFAGGPRAIIPSLAIMAGISFLIWSATFAVFSFVSLARIFLTPVLTGKPRDSIDRRKQSGVADPWLDGSV
jgi:hypothetical protein